MTATRIALFVQAAHPAAYPPVINAATLLADRGWDVHVLAAPYVGMQLAFPADTKIKVRNIGLRDSFVVTKSYYARYCAASLAAAVRLSPTLIYASDPLAALPALFASSFAGKGSRIVYHEHDSPNANSDLNPLVAWSRRRLAKRADRVVFPNAERAARAVGELGVGSERVAIVWNVPRRLELPCSAKHPDRPFVLYYHGTINPDRLPETVPEAVSTFEGRVILRIAGYETGEGGHVARLEKRFGRVADGGLIDFMGQVPRDRLLQEASLAHAGLALMPMRSHDINMRAMAGASNKAFDYMAAGLPVIVSDLPDWRSLFVDGGHALAVDPADAASVAAAIGRLIEDPAARAAMAARNRQKIETDWNYETQFAPLLSFLDQPIEP